MVSAHGKVAIETDEQRDRGLKRERGKVSLIKYATSVLPKVAFDADLMSTLRCIVRELPMNSYTEGRD